MSDKIPAGTPPEIAALQTVYTALHELDTQGQLRVIRWAAELLKLPSLDSGPSSTITPESRTEQIFPPPPSAPQAQEQLGGSEDGISPVAQKWMRRSGFDSKALQPLFSLGIDEIDLVAKDVPGKSSKARMRSVLLLKGIAAYLGSGVARMSDEKVREACIHYNAYDQANFATYVRSLAAEVGGSKEGGYTLTARGIAEATDLIKQMIDGRS